MEIYCAEMNKSGIRTNILKIINLEKSGNGYWGRKKRCLHMKLRKVEPLTQRRWNISKTDVRVWFENTQQYLEGNQLISIFKDPKRIFNYDEAAI